MKSAVLALLVLLAGVGTAQAAESVAMVKADQGGSELARGNLNAALGLLNEALAAPDLPNDRRASILNDRGVANWRLGDLKAAIDDFNGAVAIFPEFAPVYTNRGNVLLALGNTAEAIKDFERSILLSPNYAAAYNNRAIAHMQMQRYDAAIADFAKAAELSPTASAPLNGRGRAQLAQGRPFAAIRDFSRAIALDPNYRAGYRNRAQVRMALKHYDAAVQDLENALVFAPDEASLLMARGEALLKGRGYGPAIRDFTRVLELNPAMAEAHAKRGLAYALLGADKSAMEDFAKAIEIDQRNVSAYTYRALFHRRNKEPELALPDVERALKLDPKSAEAFRERGMIQEAMGRSEAAIVDFKRAADIAPDDAETWAGLKRLTGAAPPGPKPVKGTEFDEWRIYKDAAGRYLAISEKFPQLPVPLETYGKPPPRLLDWQILKTPFKGIGLLRYSAGAIEGTTGSEPYEQVAVIDLYRNVVVSLEPYRQGQKLASWSWLESGQLTVLAPDGATTTLALRGSGKQTVRNSGQTDTDTVMGRTGDSVRVLRPKTKQKTASAKPRRRKQKTIFDLLFGQ